ncbi:unnamed protein product, partial [Mesorhabditis belari]|uniref:Protein kinase domain-containing protein n=1 Tax=Mesorhabditis belari TaxID=2138241 RepID=A0AAF3ENJ2_9BILA
MTEYEDGMIETRSHTSTNDRFTRVNHKDQTVVRKWRIAQHWDKIQENANKRLFERECLALNALKHPNIVEMIGWKSNENDFAVIYLRYVGKISLDKAKKSLDPGETTTWDSGGTPQYQPPESHPPHGREATFDEKGDVYAIGITLWEMIQRSRVWPLWIRNDSPTVYRNSLLSLISQCDDEFKGIVEVCTLFSPELRANPCDLLKHVRKMPETKIYTQYRKELIFDKDQLFLLPPEGLGLEFGEKDNESQPETLRPPSIDTISWRIRLEQDFPSTSTIDIDRIAEINQNREKIQQKMKRLFERVGLRGEPEVIAEVKLNLAEIKNELRFKDRLTDLSADEERKLRQPIVAQRPRSLTSPANYSNRNDGRLAPEDPFHQKL